MLDQLKTDRIAQLMLVGLVIALCFACGAWGFFMVGFITQESPRAQQAQPPPATVQSQASPTREPTMTPRPASTHTPTAIPLPTADEAQAKASWTSVDIRDLVKNPDRYKEQKVHYKGEVFTIEEDGQAAALQVWVQIPGGTEFDREAVIVYFRGGTDGIYKDTTVEFWGYCKGALEGKNAFGSPIRNPLIVAEYLTYFE